MIVFTEALIIKKINYGDTSAIIRLFSRNYGKISIMIKGARKSKKHIYNLCESGNLINLHFYYSDKKTLYQYKDIELIHSFPDIRLSIKKMGALFSIVEFIDKTMEDNIVDKLVFRLSYKVLEQIDHNNINIEFYLCFFIWQLYRLLGILKDHQFCEQCQEKLDSIIIEDLSYLLLCKQCSQNSLIKLNNNNYKYLQLLDNIHLKNINKQSMKQDMCIVVLDYLLYLGRIEIPNIHTIKSIKMFKNYTK